MRQKENDQRNQDDDAPRILLLTIVILDTRVLFACKPFLALSRIVTIVSFKLIPLTNTAVRALPKATAYWVARPIRPR